MQPSMSASKHALEAKAQPNLSSEADPLHLGRDNAVAHELADDGPAIDIFEHLRNAIVQSELRFQVALTRL